MPGKSEGLMTKILVAEDDQDIRELIVLSLRFSGYDVIPAADGQQAVDLAFEEQPDLIMLDLRMPRLNGYEALEQIKARPGLEHVPVVILSAKGQDAEIQTGLDLGASQYILKPFAPDELVLKIGQIVAASKETATETP
jgi:two-component system phosphate regulon response regulator PhoB